MADKLKLECTFTPCCDDPGCTGLTDTWVCPFCSKENNDSQLYWLYGMEGSEDITCVSCNTPITVESLWVAKEYQYVCFVIKEIK